tara:strand:+ start:60 stop:167 length:108 start_codon:yes stop_codon:yes gene_type:complete
MNTIMAIILISGAISLAGLAIYAIRRWMEIDERGK